MNTSLVFLLLAATAALLVGLVSADIAFNRIQLADSDVTKSGLLCVPGRTTIRVQKKEGNKQELLDSDEYDDESGRRNHMNYKKNKENDRDSKNNNDNKVIMVTKNNRDDGGNKGESCKMCVCAASGQAQHCSERPAKNVNECLRMAMIVEQFQSNKPYDHERTLAFRVRRVGSGLDKSCVPFVSQYSDCSDANRCSGCTRCTCTAAGEWSCARAAECARQYTPLTDDTLDNALSQLYSEMKTKEVEGPGKYQKLKPKAKEDLLLDNDDNIEKKIMSLMTRIKRSIDGDSNHKDYSSHNASVKFYHATDEINEDTLKGSNASGIVQALKVEMLTQPSRKSELYAKNASDPLQIEYKPQNLIHPITDNKIDVTVHTDDNVVASGDRVPGIVANYTQREKDKDLSKLVVNELKKGSEVIGGKTAPVMSNITFTPENDTLTAMAFIAGNLLNKLWNMEKVSSDETVGTDAMRNEKIADLLDLFKEPLSMRQESFLKTALEKLSESIDKNKDNSNASMCEQAEEAKRFLQEAMNSTWETTKLTQQAKQMESNIRLNTTGKHPETPTSNQNQTVVAIKKINSVLSLIRKYESVNKHLNTLRRMPTSNYDKYILRGLSSAESGTLSDNENESMNLFGSILEKITKLLLPERRNNKILNKINTQNIFDDPKGFQKKFKETYNIELDNITLTVKDKIILDYLGRINQSPNCLLGEQFHKSTKTRPNVEGDILRNLSEYYKIKSFVDLVKLLDDSKPEKSEAYVVPTATTEASPSKLARTTTELLKDTTIDDSRKFSNTKEKLKAHLKTILDDLVELQKEKGIPTKKGEIRIADALPCIYNLMYADGEVQNNILNDKLKPHGQSRLERVKTNFDSLKRDLKTVSQTRRNIQSDTKERPKSAVVLERLMNDLNKKKIQMISRRSTQKDSPKTVEELEKMIAGITLSSQTKNKEQFSSNVLSGDRMMYFKALEFEIKLYIDALKSIRASLSNLENLPVNKQNKFKQFIENVAKEISTKEQLMKRVIQTKSRQTIVSDIVAKAQSNFLNRGMTYPKIPLKTSYKKNNMRLTRDQILNQLIKNRVQFYLRLKDSNGANIEDDHSYNIAKHILDNLEKGDYTLARELYKVFVSTKNQVSSTGVGEIAADPAISKILAPLQQTILDKEPLLRFEDPKPVESQVKLFSHDQMLRQLLSSKNLRS